MDAMNYLKDEAKRAWEKAEREMGRATVLVTGPTGVGKSTLINKIFSKEFAKVGAGKPVTQEEKEYEKKGSPLRIIDTRGIETKDYEGTKKRLQGIIDTRRKDANPDRHIHLAWLCIDEGPRRIQESDVAVAKMLAAAEIPTIAVITKARQDKDPSGRTFTGLVAKELPVCKRCIRVRAEEECDDDGYVEKPMGLRELIAATLEIAPEGRRRAVVAAQKVSMEEKVLYARGIVAASATAAAGVGAAPIPFADALALVPIQMGMFAAITKVFGLPVDEAFIATLLAAVVGGGGAALVGREIAVNLLKFVPGINLAAGAINAATAGALTTALGLAYIETLHALYAESGGAAPSPDVITERFVSTYRSGSAGH